MTPSDLHRLADRDLAASASLALDAGRLRAEAEVLAGMLEPLLAISARYGPDRPRKILKNQCAHMGGLST